MLPAWRVLQSFDSPKQSRSKTAASPKRLHPSLADATGRAAGARAPRRRVVAGSKRQPSRASRSLAEQAAFINRALARRAERRSRRARCSSSSTPSSCDVDAADLPALARDTAITRVVGVSDYAQDLSETVPYIGAATAHALRRDRQGRPHRGHRQRHRLHAQGAGRSGHAGRVRGGLGAASGRRLRRRFRRFRRAPVIW